MNATRRKAIHDAMVRLSDGDRTAFDLLLNELWPIVVSFVGRGVGYGPDAEDVAQEVFVKICAKIADFDQDRDGLSWAFGIASYEVMTHRRRRQRRREILDEAAFATRADESVSQEEQLLENEIDVSLKEAARALSDEDRRTLELDGKRPTGSVSATMRKRKQRALGRLRDLWRNIYGES